MKFRSGFERFVFGLSEVLPQPIILVLNFINFEKWTKKVNITIFMNTSLPSIFRNVEASNGYQQSSLTFRPQVLTKNSWKPLDLLLSIFKRHPHKMVKHNQTIRQQNNPSVFRLTLKHTCTDTKKALILLSVVQKHSPRGVL